VLRKKRPFYLVEVGGNWFNGQKNGKKGSQSDLG